MEWSNYNIILDYDHELLFLNSLSLNLIPITTNIKDIICSSSPNSLPTTFLEDFIKGGFVINDRVEERKSYIDSFKNAINEKVLSVKFLLSTTCNSACVYCYQKFAGYYAQIIDVKKIDIFFMWVDNYVRLNRIKEFSLELFGGEPLLAHQYFPYLFKKLSEFKSNNNIKTQVSIISNLSLLTDDLIQILVDNDVEFKISIDGNKQVHDSRRHLKNGESSYDKTVEAIKKIAQLGRIDLVTARMNVDKNNIGEVSYVADLMHNLGVQRFYCGIVHFRRKTTNYSPYIFSEKDLILGGINKELFDIVSKYGYADTPCSISLYEPCQFYRKHSYVISPILEVAKCDELLDIREQQIGRIDDDGVMVFMNDNYNLATTNTPDMDPECKECNYLPLCGRGCPIAAMNETGSPFNHVCMNKELLKDKIKLLLSVQDEN
jgi:uncharacterized protein